MAEDYYARFARFCTPDPRPGPREQVPMSAEEQAWAHERAAVHRTGWLQVLLFPLIFGSVLPGLFFMLGLVIFQRLFAGDFDVDEVLAGSVGWVIFATLLCIGGWVLYNAQHAKCDLRRRYWRAMPGKGMVELEHHRLLSGISLWSNGYDPDIPTISQWIDGRMQVVADSGVSEWMLARTAAGHWLVLRQRYRGTFDYSNPRLPALERRLQASHELAIALAPGTNVALGQRFTGTLMPLVQTTYWLSRTELQRLDEIAHHWIFFYPDRYAVVNAQDVDWVEALVARAEASIAS